MTPERAYKVREGMFLMDVTPPIFAGPLAPPALRCALCGEAVMVEAEVLRAVDVGVLVEACRQHEITRHSTAVTEQQFRMGYNVSWMDPPPPELWKNPGDARWKTEHRQHEWLDSPGPGLDGVLQVVVRDPEALWKWDSMRRAYPEMAGLR